MKPKCHECDREAKWLIEDLPGLDERFIPLCEKHFQDVVQMEGEMNLDFDSLDSLDLDDIIRRANNYSLWVQKRHLNTLKRLGAAEGRVKELEKLISE